MRAEGEASEVLIVSTLGAPPRRRWRRARARPVERETPPERLPLTRLTVVTPQGLGDAPEAARWLDRSAADPGAAEELLDDALRIVNRALRAHAAGAQDPYVHEVSAPRAAAVRIGYGEGEQVANGQWADARELERREPRRRRAESLQPQERVAAVLGGRERMHCCETVILRARLDLDGGHLGEAALQLRVGLAALLAELEPQAGDELQGELATLRARQAEVGALAEAALRGEPNPDTEAALGDILARCERALRRHRLGTSL